MGFFSNIVSGVQQAAQSVGSAVQQVSQQVVSATQNAIQSGQQALSNAGDAVVLAPLLPFKKAMVRALKNKGESVELGTPMKRVVPLFYKRIVKKENYINYQEFEHLDEETVQQLLSMVAPILDFIKTLINKKESGKQLSPEEQLIYEDAKTSADAVVTTGGAVTTTGEPANTGNWLKDNKILVIGVIAVVLFLAFRKK